ATPTGWLKRMLGGSVPVSCVTYFSPPSASGLKTSTTPSNGSATYTSPAAQSLRLPDSSTATSPVPEHSKQAKALLGVSVPFQTACRLPPALKTATTPFGLPSTNSSPPTYTSASPVACPTATPW